jgi:basic amino acid/polyamine antiporter, APA family
MKPTLGLAGVTVNAMAMIAPGACMWFTYGEQCLYGAPMAGSGMWFGIVIALALCFATAISYSELAKLYPGAGSAYFFAEQAFLAKTNKQRFARLAKFIIGWGSHIYYWVLPGVLVGVTAVAAGYLVGQLWPSIFVSATPSPLFMVLFCIVFAYGVGYIAFRGINSTTNVNFTINVIQIAALTAFAVMAIAYRANHPQGSTGFTLDPDGNPVDKVIAYDKDGNPIKDKNGNYVFEMGADGKTPKPFILDYSPAAAVDKGSDPKNPVDTREFFPNAASVVEPHGLSFALVQACVAILLLVGFESATSLGEEARNPRRDISRAVLLSLLIQGLICYLFEYFAANYFLNSGYTMTTASGSAAPIGDMMVIVGTWAFGSLAAGKAFMLIEAATVLIALIGCTLSCINMGARVTYAMGRDEEIPSHFGLLHGRRLSPHRAIWALTTISAMVGIFAVLGYFCNGAALTDDAIKALPHNAWYSFGIIRHDLAVKLPQTMLVVTLTSNFGTFLLFMLTNYVAMVAFKEHHTFNGFKHFFVPLFGLLANLLCMIFYIVGPYYVGGMSKREPWCALAVAAFWALYGGIYFVYSSKKKGRQILLNPKPDMGG